MHIDYRESSRLADEKRYTVYQASTMNIDGLFNVDRLKYSITQNIISPPFHVYGCVALRFEG